MILDIARLIIVLLLMFASYVGGMFTMGIFASNGKEQSVEDAFQLGYEKGKLDEYERIGKLLDKYIEDLEKNKTMG